MILSKLACSHGLDKKQKYRFWAAAVNINVGYALQSSIGAVVSARDL